ncbi:unnamed protein product, partial [Acanthoscelides obtectus]
RANTNWAGSCFDSVIFILVQGHIVTVACQYKLGRELF